MVPPDSATGLRSWLATGEAAVPRLARVALRSLNRATARLRSGSVAAEMDRIVAEATQGSTGSGLSVGPGDVSRRRRARSARATHDRAAGSDPREGRS